MATAYRCRAVGCQQRHNSHYCKICHDKDSDHRALNCPYSQMQRIRKKRIINGDIVYLDTYDKIIQEGTEHVKSRIFNGVWNYLITIIIAYIHSLVHYVEYAILWDVVAILMLCVCRLFWIWIKPALMRIGKMDKVYLALHAIGYAVIAVLCAFVFDLRTRVVQLEYGYDVLSEGLKAIDQRVDEYDKRYNETFLKKDTWIGTLDGHLVTALARMGISRARLRMGCYIEGTQIQVDEFGNTMYIEDFRTGDYVYSPLLEDRFPAIPIHGYETGYMYEFITEDHFSLTVTQYHAMYIVDNNQEYNIAAEDVVKGNSTLTAASGEYQKFVEIRKIPVDNIRVFNLLILVPVDIPITSRSIIADGIVTLDFKGQQVHEKRLM
eukprot:210579_1